MIALRRLLTLLAWLVGEVATVGALIVLGSRRPFTVTLDGFGQWVGRADPADAVIVMLRWVALGGACWVLAGTALYLVVSLTRVPGAIRAVRWAAVPSVRRAVDAALAVSVVAGSVLGPAVASAATSDVPPATSVRDGHSRGLASLPAEPTTTTPVAPTAPITQAPAPAIPNDVVVVAPGDNLWEIAAHHLATATGRARADVGDVEVAPYWVAVCDRNRATLASGDPNLIFVGERVALPPVS